jgi:hypothetical protein
MREWWRRAVAAAAGPVAAGVAAGTVAACGSSSAVLPAGPASAKPAVTRAATPERVPYDLYTHCGIYSARIGNRYYEAARPLSDGAGNPPPGWDNPYQAGTMTLVSPTEAVFTDKAGHRVVFNMKPPGAKSIATVCA